MWPPRFVLKPHSVAWFVPWRQRGVLWQRCDENSFGAACFTLYHMLWRDFIWKTLSLLWLVYTLYIQPKLLLRAENLCLIRVWKLLYCEVCASTLSWTYELMQICDVFMGTNKVMILWNKATEIYFAFFNLLYEMNKGWQMRGVLLFVGTWGGLLMERW